jgi:hypothetical protein
LIDCVTELQTRIIVQVLPYQDSHNTPLQGILTKWHCQQCQQCVAFKEKVLMKNFREEDFEPYRRRPKMRKYKRSEQTWNCSYCHKVNPTTVLICACGSLMDQSCTLPVLDEPVLPAKQRVVFDDVCWKCTRCMYEYNLKDSKQCLKCRTPNPRFVSVAQEPAHRNSVAALPVRSDVSTNSQLQSDPFSSNGNKARKALTQSTQLAQLAEQPILGNSIPVPQQDSQSSTWTCHWCHYEYNTKFNSICVQCGTSVLKRA